MTFSRLERLPAEILGRCCFFVRAPQPLVSFTTQPDLVCVSSKPPENPSSHTFQPDIASLRLVSKIISAAASPQLIISARLYLSSTSLARLEQIALHPIFSKSIRDIEINLSYYDVLLAEHPNAFTALCVTELERLADIELSARDDLLIDATDIFWIVDEWREMDGQLLAGGDRTDMQMLLATAYTEYKRRYHDQQEIQAGDAYLSRMSSIFEQLPALTGISLTDAVIYRCFEPQIPLISFKYPSCRTIFEHSNDLEYKTADNLVISPAFLLDICLQSSSFRGTIETLMSTEPPTYIIPAIFNLLATTSIRPTTCSISLTPPQHLSSLQLTKPQVVAIKTVLSRTSAVSMTLSTWRADYFIDDEEPRPQTDVLALCSLTKAYFASATIRNLHLCFRDYPYWPYPPAVSIEDILPIGSWPHLEDLELRGVPFRMTELGRLVRTTSPTVKNLKLEGLHLIDGTWDKGISLLRNFTNLYNFSGFTQVSSGEDEDDHREDMLHQRIVPYVLRQSDQNPLELWYGTSD